MSLIRRNSTRIALIGLLISTGLTGCNSSSNEDIILDPLHLIDNFDKNPPRHHPRKLIEISLGTLDIRMPTKDGFQVVEISFDAHIVVPREKQAELEERVQQRRSRVHDTINRVLMEIDPKELSDPNMTWMKSELIPVMNRVLQSDDVRDVVFSDLSVNIG